MIASAAHCDSSRDILERHNIFDIVVTAEIFPYPGLAKIEIEVRLFGV